ncbi:MAG: substrate-binding domain-containing protein [Thermodesulfobacteriota bacterium]
MTNKENGIQIYCAGSLREVMGDIGERFRVDYGPRVTVTAGPSGLLRERIEAGDRPDLFASANLEHPRKLKSMKLAGPTVTFARNRLCVMSKAELELTQANILDKLLDPGVRLGTSTPVVDPGGDYAWAMFKKAEELRPGSFRRLTDKARQIVRGPTFPPSKPGVLSLIEAFENDEVDLYVAYRTTAHLLIKRVPGIVITELPAELEIEAFFGLTLIEGACAQAGPLALYLLAPEGQRVLADYGFIPVLETSECPESSIH